MPDVRFRKKFVRSTSNSGRSHVSREWLQTGQNGRGIQFAAQSNLIAK